MKINFMIINPTTKLVKLYMNDLLYNFVIKNSVNETVTKLKTYTSKYWRSHGSQDPDKCFMMVFDAEIFKQINIDDYFIMDPYNYINTLPHYYSDDFDTDVKHITFMSYYVVGDGTTLLKIITSENYLSSPVYSIQNSPDEIFINLLKVKHKHINDGTMGIIIFQGCLTDIGL